MPKQKAAMISRTTQSCLCFRLTLNSRLVLTAMLAFIRYEAKSRRPSDLKQHKGRAGRDKGL